MTKQTLLTTFKIEDINDLPASITKLLEGDIIQRNEVYSELLELNNHDLSYDWFQQVYEGELAQRGEKKQDFTPNSVGRLASLLTGQQGSVYEPTAGNGSMIIADWWERCRKLEPWNYKPSANMVTCWELSSRAIPLLLFNLSIRGIMGYVYHGDTLEMTIKAKYILLNRHDDSMAFSEVVKDEKLNAKIIQIQ